VSSTILAIDDEPANLLIIEEFLSDSGYTVRCMEDPREALAYLRDGGEADAILLDRTMPYLDGISFMAELKQMPERKHLPVIMQTAIASPEKIAEGIEAGVFYYLTKPFEKSLLCSLLRRALADREIYAGHSAELKERQSALERISMARFSFQSLDDVRAISNLLASFFPTPDGALLGIRELMLNAVEHGNLGIDYKLKSELMEEGRWESEIERRLSMLEYSRKFATVEIERGEAEICLRIVDQGEGFDWKSYTNFDTDRMLDAHGRGIFMAKAISFDDIEYLPPGNRVVCRKLIQQV
jgi:CheY-like chemotaxis protein